MTSLIFYKIGVVIHRVIMTSPGGAIRYYEVNYVLIPCLLMQTGLSRGIWSMPKSDISISAEQVISRHGIIIKIPCITRAIRFTAYLDF